jgi:small multidrug resistance family-3 protein
MIPYQPSLAGILYGSIVLMQLSWRYNLQILKSLFYFLVAGLCEIGGGYLVWLWLREGKSLWYGIAGGAVLVFYGVVPTLQPANFGRVYAAYGGIFIVLSILWGWRIDKVPPDRFDIIGGMVSLVGVLIIMYWPRG